MTDDDLLATCIASEAAGEIYAGKVAIGWVVLSRMALRYSSDGTVHGTVLRPDQFSGFWFDMVSGKYTRVVSSANSAGALARAENMRIRFAAQSVVWADCHHAVGDARAAVAGDPLGFVPPPEFRALTSHTVLYDNPRISRPQPWAVPDRLVTTIGHHQFYHA